MDEIKIEIIKTDVLKAYKKNAKKHPDKQIEHIANSIKEFGFKQPIVVDRNNEVIIGHGRLMAAKRLGLEQVPCIRANELTDVQIKALRLADNKTNESDWDWELMAEELEELKIDYDMSMFGFEVNQESEVVEDEYAKPAPRTAKSKPGQLYQLGRHRLYCGDATIEDDVKKLTRGGVVDQLLTDPPYNVDYTGGTEEALKIENDHMADDAFRAFLTDAFKAAKSVMKPGAAFHIWHADSEGYNFRGACRDAGLLIRQCLIWEKNSLVLGRQDFQWIHEPCLYGENPPPKGAVEEFMTEDNEVCLYGWKDGGSHYWYKNRKQTTILKFDRPTKSKEHPTMKPVLLFSYEMECNTKPGEIVLDLFAGSGTTIIAAEQNGRVAYCMEKDPRYVDVIIDRWEVFTGSKAVLLEKG